MFDSSSKMVCCSIRGCKNRSGKNPTVKFFTLPRDKAILEKWLEYCRPNTTSIKNGRVCSVHFTSSEFSVPLQYSLLNIPVPKSIRSLKKDAVPTLHLDNEQNMASKSLLKPIKQKICEISTEDIKPNITDECYTIAANEVLYVDSAVALKKRKKTNIVTRKASEKIPMLILDRSVVYVKPREQKPIVTLKSNRQKPIYFIQSSKQKITDSLKSEYDHSYCHDDTSVNNLLSSPSDTTAASEIDNPLKYVEQSSTSNATAVNYVDCPIQFIEKCSPSNATEINDAEDPIKFVEQCSPSNATAIDDTDCPIKFVEQCSPSNATAGDDADCPIKFVEQCSPSNATAVDDVDCPIKFVEQCSPSNATAVDDADCPMKFVEQRAEKSTMSLSEQKKLQKDVKEYRILKNNLKSIFSPGQIRALMKADSRRVFWASEDITAGFSLLRSIGPKAYYHLKTSVGIPLPAFSTLRRWSATKDC